MLAPINTEIRQQLEKFHCTHGHLRYQSRNGSTVLAFSGQLPDGHSVLLWQNTPLLGKLIARYLEEQPGQAGVEIDIDLEKESFAYRPVTEATFQKETREAKGEIERANQEKRQNLEQRTEKYGPALAERVADALQTKELMDTHRDYCGMGLRSEEGAYFYGEVWDGGMVSPRKFGDRAEFVAWLAGQSDAAMSRLEEKSPWYWGNQVLNREILENFAGVR